MPGPERRLLYLRIAIVAGTFAGMILSHALWVSTRFYPLTPVFALLKPIPFPFDHILFDASLLALLVSAITRRLIPFFAILAIVLVVCDQSRLQPWFYEYFLLLLGVAFASPNACRLIVAATYFWSGAQKLNAGFINDVFPWMLEPFLRHLPHGAQATVHPLIGGQRRLSNCGIGIALLGRKFRTPASDRGGRDARIHLDCLESVGAELQPRCLAMEPHDGSRRRESCSGKSSDSARQVLFSKNAFHIAALLTIRPGTDAELFRLVGSLPVRSDVYEQYESRDDFHQRQCIRPPA